MLRLLPSGKGENIRMLPKILIALVWLSFLILPCAAEAQQSHHFKVNKSILDLARADVANATGQYMTLIKRIASGKFPKRQTAVSF